LRRKITIEEKDKEKAEKEAEDIIDNRIKVYFLPKLYKEKYMDSNKNIKKVAEVDYTIVLKDFKINPKDISSKLVVAAKKKQEYIKEGVKVIRALDPKRLGLGDVLKDLKAFFTRNFPALNKQSQSKNS